MSEPESRPSEKPAGSYSNAPGTILVYHGEQQPALGPMDALVRTAYMWREATAQAQLLESNGQPISSLCVVIRCKEVPTEPEPDRLVGIDGDTRRLLTDFAVWAAMKQAQAVADAQGHGQGYTFKVVPSPDPKNKGVALVAIKIERSE